MPRVPILGGAYQSRAIIASSQRCINLYPEANIDQQAPAPVTHFPTPGLRRVGTPPNSDIGRCVYRASTGDLFEVVGGSVYYVDNGFAYHLLGTIINATTPVIMADNGLVVVLVDGSLTGYAINLNAVHGFAPINDPFFLGASHVGFCDGVFVFNVPGENKWFISLDMVTFGNLTQLTPYPNSPDPGNPWYAFDPLDFNGKLGSTDPIRGLVVMHRDVWIIGSLTGEVWYDSGSADFLFSIAPGVFSERGTEARYSIAADDNAVCWMSQSKLGESKILRWRASFQIETVSPPGMEAIIGSFAKVDDAIAGCYQLYGHTYYVITFPTAGRSFAVEVESQQWHELCWTGPNGLERHRSNGWAFAYKMVLTCDRQTGVIYQLDPTVFTDDGAPITRVRTIPHILNEGRRVRIDRVIADTQGGTQPQLEDEEPPTLFLRVSTDRGGSFSDALPSSMGATGEYEGMPSWYGLGLGRDIVFEVSWSAPIDTALNGLFVEATPAVS